MSALALRSAVLLVLGAFQIEGDSALELAYRQAQPLTIEQVANGRSSDGFQLPKPLERGHVDLMRRRVAMSDAQFAAFQRAYLNYVDRHNEHMLRELEPVVQATASHPVTFLRPMDVEVELPFRRQMQRHMQRQFEALWQIEAELYREFESALTEDQRHDFSRFLSWRSRDRLRSMLDSTLPELHVELREVLTSAVPSGELRDLPPDVLAVLDRYELELQHQLSEVFQRGLRAHVDEYAALGEYQQRLMRESAAGQAPLRDALDRVESIRRERIQNAARVRRLQEASREEITAMLTPGVAQEFLLVYGRAAYPKIYAHAGEIANLADAALMQLDHDAMAAVDSIFSAAQRYTVEERQLLSRWVAAEQAWRERLAWDAIVDRADHVGHHLHVRAFAAQRDAIVAAHLLELSSILTPSQRHAMATEVLSTIQRLAPTEQARVLEAWSITTELSDGADVQ